MILRHHGRASTSVSVSGGAVLLGAVSEGASGDSRGSEGAVGASSCGGIRSRAAASSLRASACASRSWRSWSSSTDMSLSVSDRGAPLSWSASRNTYRRPSAPLSASSVPRFTLLRSASTVSPSTSAASFKSSRRLGMCPPPGPPLYTRYSRRILPYTGRGGYSALPRPGEPRLPLHVGAGKAHAWIFTVYTYTKSENCSSFRIGTGPSGRPPRIACTLSAGRGPQKPPPGADGPPPGHPGEGRHPPGRDRGAS